MHTIGIDEDLQMHEYWNRRSTLHTTWNSIALKKNDMEFNSHVKLPSSCVDHFSQPAGTVVRGIEARSTHRPVPGALLPHFGMGVRF